MAFITKVDRGECPKCKTNIGSGDEVRENTLGQYEHAFCNGDPADAEAVEYLNRVDWRTAESIERAAWEEQEIRRVEPLGKQGKCPICFIEYPLTGICDEHGRAA